MSKDISKTTHSPKEEKPSPRQAFRTAYAALNPAQKQAVDTIEGPVMVVAGPGTGKTQILAVRAANILLKTDVGAHNILALTFTETGAKAMRERLISIIGEEAYYVTIATFHAFCSDIIQSHPDHFPFARASEPLSDIDRFSIIENIIQKQPFEYVKPINSPTFYVRDCIKAIKDLKREGVSPERLRKMIDRDAQVLHRDDMSPTAHRQKETQVNRNRELLQVYLLYQEKLQASSKYDFEDMIAFVVEAFSKDDMLLREYQERLQYILVDEYQDTNNAQNAVLDLLGQFWGEQANIFVVGDISQSLYRFQGASTENTLAFAKKFPHAIIITLEQNYRSSQLILDAAAALIAKNSFTHANVLHVLGKNTKHVIKEQPLRATKDLPSQKIRIAQFSSDVLQHAFVAQEVSALITDGVSPSEIAILYRNNTDSFAYADALAKWGVKFEIDGGSNILESPVIQQLLTLFSVIHSVRSVQEDLDFFTLMNYAWVNLDALDVLKLTRHASKHKMTIFESLQEGNFANTGVKDEKKLLGFTHDLIKWSTFDAQKTFPEWFETIVKESGYLNWVLGRIDAVEILNQLRSLFSQVKTLSRSDHKLNLVRFLEVVALMRVHRIAINEEDLNIRTDAVRLSTAHRAKGLEWEYVFIVEALDGKWGNVKTRELIKLPEAMLEHTHLEEKERNEDERRVFYVALTRGKRQVTIAYPNTTVSANRTKQNFPAMFIQEIPEALKEDVETSQFEQGARELLTRILQPPQEIHPSLEEQEWLTSMLEDFVLSPTALNTYLKCPYKFKLNVLMRVPRAKQDYLGFGSAVHKALEVLARQTMEHHTIPTKEFFLETFEKALEREVLTADDHAKRLLQGQKILSAYYDEYHDQFGNSVFVEKFFGYGWTKIFVDDVRIGGRIDKIEWMDKRAKTVCVVDYKTGRPKTRGEIEGTTANSTGDYKRQLVFYKLLTDLDRTFTYKVERGLFDFVEKDPRTKKFRREEFSLGKEEVDALRALIKDTMREIRALHFPRTYDRSACKDCEFASHCWPEGIEDHLEQEQLKLVK